MKLLTLNIRHGGGRRVEKILAFVRNEQQRLADRRQLGPLALQQRDRLLALDVVIEQVARPARAAPCIWSNP